MDILDAVAVTLVCPTCKRQYAVTLKQILLSKQMLHEGCPLQNQYTTECPPPYYADLATCTAIEEIERLWFQLKALVAEVGGELTVSMPQRSPTQTHPKAKSGKTRRR